MLRLQSLVWHLGAHPVSVSFPIFQASASPDRYSFIELKCCTMKRLRLSGLSIGARPLAAFFNGRWQWRSGETSRDRVCGSQGSEGF